MLIAEKMRVGVVVLGDVGHSPRMCYHALSLANNDNQVTKSTLQCYISMDKDALYKGKK